MRFVQFVRFVAFVCFVGFVRFVLAMPEKHRYSGYIRGAIPAVLQGQVLDKPPSRLI